MAKKQIKGRATNNKHTPTLKEKKFAKVYVETGSKTKAYKEAYDSDNMKLSTIHREAVVTASKPQVQTLIDRALKRMDVTIDSVLERKRELMQQNKHLPTALNATRDLEEQLGVRTDEVGDKSVKIAFIINTVDK